MSQDFEPTYPSEAGGRRAGRLDRERRLQKWVIAWTFMAWAAVGLLSGHMHMLGLGSHSIGILHFQGTAALLFSLGILAIAGMQWAALMADTGGGIHEPWYRRTRVVLWTLVLTCLAGAVVARGSGWGDDHRHAWLTAGQFVKAGSLAGLVRWAPPWSDDHAWAVFLITAGAIFWMVVVLVLQIVRPVHPWNRRRYRERLILLTAGGVVAAAGLILICMAYLGSTEPRTAESVVGVSRAYSVMIGCICGVSMLMLELSLQSRRLRSAAQRNSNSVNP